MERKHIAGTYATQRERLHKMQEEQKQAYRQRISELDQELGTIVSPVSIAIKPIDETMRKHKELMYEHEEVNAKLKTLTHVKPETPQIKRLVYIGKFFLAFAVVYIVARIANVEQIFQGELKGIYALIALGFIEAILVSAISLMFDELLSNSFTKYRLAVLQAVTVIALAAFFTGLYLHQVSNGGS